MISTAKYLPGDFPWIDRIHCFETIASTNTRAKEMAAAGAPQGTVLIADAQTGGRGRMGRSFHSPAGCGIYLSVILRPGCHASQLMHLTCSTGIAACNAIESTCGIRPGIKWINDLVLGQRKLGGILTELSLLPDGTVDWAIIGIGINCCQQAGDFPEDIRSIATSLRIASGNTVDRDLVAAAVLTELEIMSKRLLTHRQETMEAYRKDCITIGQDISIIAGDRVRHGRAVNVEEDGALTVKFPDGHLEKVNSGEVSIRGMYGYIR